MEHRVLLNGKHRDRTFAQAEADRSYCAWLLRAVSLPLSLRPFQHFLRQRHGGIFTVGRHNGRWFDEVFDADPSYTAWAASLPSASGSLLEFQSYIASAASAATRASSRSPRRTRAQVDRVELGDEEAVDWPKECRVCYDLPVRTVFAGCGHIVCCTRCALEFKKSALEFRKRLPCPICREPVLEGDVVRLYGS